MLEITTAAVGTTKSLRDTISRIKGRHKIRRLEEELAGLVNILETLQAAEYLEPWMPPLLRSSISRCSELCHDFEIVMEGFHGESPKTSFQTWVKKGLMTDDINQFIEALGVYKTTLSVALATINMLVPHSAVSILYRHSQPILLGTTQLPLSRP